MTGHPCTRSKISVSNCCSAYARSTRKEYAVGYPALARHPHAGCLRCRIKPCNAGSKEITMMPTMIRVRLFFTTGMLPKK